MTADLDALLDRSLIRRTLRRYSQGLDQRQWEVFRSAFAPGAIVSVPGWVAGSVTVETFIDLLSGEFDSLRISGQHHLANTLVQVSGDTARAVTEFLAINLERVTSDPLDHRTRTQFSGGLQVDDLIRYGDEWLIGHRVIVRKNDESRTGRLPSPQLFAGAATDPAVAGF